MKIISAIFLAAVLALGLSGCSPSTPAVTPEPTGSIRPTATSKPTATPSSSPKPAPTTAPAVSDNPAFHAVVGKVELTSGGETVIPLCNYLFSTDYMDGGFICGDGLSLFWQGGKAHEKIEREAPEVPDSGSFAANIIGNNGKQGGYEFYDMNFKAVDTKIQINKDGSLQLPAGSNVCYGRLIVTWQAESCPPGFTDKESKTWEYIFKVKAKQ